MTSSERLTRPAKTLAETGPICIEEEAVLSPEDTKFSFFFRFTIGYLLYLSRCTRPDTTHSVMVFTKSISEPGPRTMMSKLKRVLRYLKWTVSTGKTYSGDAEDGDKLAVYVDSDNADDQDKGYSTAGVVLCLAGGPVNWRSTKQTVAAISTFEA